MPDQALQDVRVVEFGAFAAGPCIGKHLADHGAEVIRVESRGRPDGFRTHYPPYKDDVPGLERSGCFVVNNNNKLGITLDLKHPRGVELARELVKHADVVIENFTPGTIARLGLGYPVLREVKSDLVMLSTCNQGQTGPHAGHPGFGTHLSSLSGFTYLTGYPDRSPTLLYGPYIDYIAVAYGVVAVMAALEYRDRTGEGQYIDLSQYETGAQFMAPAVLDYEVNGRIAQRQGNRHPAVAPHGVYPCRGEDRWIALSVWNDQEWLSLRAVMADPEWARDQRFATVLGRKAHEDALDDHLAEWTRSADGWELMQSLQAAGVRAGVVQTMADLFTDPRLEERGHWVELEHAEMGRHAYEASPYVLSETPQHLYAPAFLLGQHNREVFTGLLGLSDDEYQRLETEGVFS